MTLSTRLARFRALLPLTALVAMGLGACADERAPIDRTQPNGMKKEFFVGPDLQGTEDDPEFYMQGTLIDVGYGASQDGLFTSTYAQPLSRVKFIITEKTLIARITYERVDGSDGKGAGVNTKDGVIAAIYRIDSHFDLTQAYNSTTGEKLNVFEENTSDRPWYERKYMRVDWSSNLATDSYDFDTLSLIGIYGGVTYEPTGYYVNDPSDEDAPKFDFDNGYFDVTTKAFAKPQLIDLSGLGWGIDAFPSCMLDADFGGGSSPSGNCNPVELTIRQSFRKITPTDYEPQHWDGKRFSAYGAFTADRYGYARNYGMSDEKWHRFISRYNIWERSHFYADPVNMTGAIECFTPSTTPYGADPHRDENGDGTEDECAAAGSGSRCDEFSQKCTLPFRDRVAKPVVWYYSQDNDETYFEPTQWATREWDTAMRSAVVTARYAECKRVGAQDCDKYPIWTGQMDENEDAIKLVTEVQACREGLAYPEKNRDRAACDSLADQIGGQRGYSSGVIATAKMDSMVELCHSPVTYTDPEICGSPRLPVGVTAMDCKTTTDDDVKSACSVALRARRGDIRYHQLTIISGAQSNSPWGIMTDATDPLTGEKVAASVNVWAAITDRASQGLIDTARYIGGELALGDITDGQYVKDWAAASEASGGGGALPRMTKADMKQKMADFMGKTPADMERYQLPKGSHAFEVARSVKSQVRDIAAKVGAASSNAPVYAARRAMAQNTPLEAALMTKAMQQYAGVQGLPMSQAVLNMASPLRAANPSVQRDYFNLKEEALAKRGACMVSEAPAPLAMTDVSRVLQDKFGNFDPQASKQEQYDRAEKMRKYVAEHYHYAVIAHEMGHSFALRHNFVSSADAFSYRPQYWQLRTKNGTVNTACDDLSTDGENCVGPRYFDPVTPNEQSNFIWMFMQDSIMEYPGEVTQDMQGIAAYDFAAVRMFYGDVAPVFADGSYNAGGDRSEGMLSKMDGFGGILGIQPQIGQEDMHYSAYQKNYDLIHDCKNVNPDDYKPATWDESRLGKWHPVFDGRLVSIDGGANYSVCKTQPVDYVNWNTLRAPRTSEIGGSYYGGGPSIDQQNRTRIPYGFGTDSWADLGNLSVYRFDNGADPYELFNFLITQQEVNHLWDNYRRGRQDFSVRGAANRSLSRYNEKLRDAAKGLGLLKNIYEYVSRDEGYNFDDFWPAVAPSFFPENLLVSGMGFDHFSRLMARPQPGNHFLPVGDKVWRSDQDIYGSAGNIRVIIPNGATGYYGNVQYGGRPLENALSDDQGEYDSEYTMNAGSYYDKSWTSMLMTESVDNFISSTRGDFYDSRYRSVSVADLFPDGYRRWLGNNLTGDDEIKGPHLAAKPDGRPEVGADKYPAQPIGWTSWWVPDGPEMCFPNANSEVCSRYGDLDSTPFNALAPANVTSIDPQIGYEQQKFLIAWTLVYLPENQQQGWLDQLRLWKVGQDYDPGMDNRIEFHNPVGETFVARTFGTEEIFGKTVQKGIAARVLEYANELLDQAYETEEVTGPDGTVWYEAKMSPVTGQPMVKWDESVAAISADGFTDPDGVPGCNATDNSQCTCAANRACVRLKEYVEVPYFLHDALDTFHMSAPGWKGVF